MVKIQWPIIVNGNKCKLLPSISHFLKTTLGSRGGRQKVSKGASCPPANPLKPQPSDLGMNEKL